MFGKTLRFLNSYRWWVYLLWIIPTFFLWSYLGYYAWQEDLDAPGMLYLFPAWVIWFFLHICTAIILAIVLAFWKFRQARSGKTTQLIR